MATSTIPTAKANLVTQLQARGALSGVQITNGPPLPRPSREFIWVGQASGRQEFATFGQATSNARLEEYDLSVTISVLHEGVDMVATDTRCFVLYGEIEAQIRSDSTINGAVTVAQVGDFRLGEFVGEKGMQREAQLVVSINCRAYI